MTDAIQITPLVADIISAQFQLTAGVTDRLIDSLQHQLAEAHARERAVEYTILALLEGPWMPTSHALIRALEPSRELVEYFLDHEKGGQ